MSDDEQELDLGDGYRLQFTGWAPDRELNPQYADLPDVPRWGAIITHPHPVTGQPCQGALTFHGPVQQRVAPQRPKWTVESFEPLTLSPSVLCGCGDHGWIRSGRWQPI